MTYHDKFLKTLKDNTERNAHTENYMFIASVLGLERHREILESIYKIHKTEGHMPYELQQYRIKVSRDMMNQVKEKYGDKLYNDIRRSI